MSEPPQNPARFRYVRVSSLDQNPERQLEGIKLDKVFTDKASAKAMLSAFAQFERRSSRKDSGKG
jgi:DNA invertase Pin-like site-specific DNA recombinase